MSNISTHYVDFKVLDFANQEKLSGYSLPISKFTFVPKISANSQISNNRFVWDFGDGTLSPTLSGVHYYNKAGTYNIRLYVYDGYGKGYLSTVTKDIKVIDFISDSLSLSATANVKYQTAGTINSPILITRTSNRTTSRILSTLNSSIYLYASGANAPLIDADEYYKDPYSHLKPYAYFATKDYDQKYKSSILKVINKTNTTSKDIYCKIIGTEIVVCKSSDSNSIFAGTSGNKIVYFVDDLYAQQYSSAPTIISVSFDNSAIWEISPDLQSPQISLGRVEHTYVKSLPTANNEYLSFSSNGWDGEGSIDTSFKINPNQFQNVYIPFVVKCKSADLYTKKYLPPLVYSATGPLSVNEFRVTLVDSNSSTITSASFNSYTQQLSTLSATGGFFKGYLTESGTHTNCFLSAIALITAVNITPGGSVTSTLRTINGVSNTFNIYPSGGNYSVAKINENISFQDRIKDFRFQETLLNNPILFDNILGSIFGNLSSHPHTIGKQTYERISNFVDNISFIDTCQVDALYSQYRMINEDLEEFDSNSFLIPPKLKRIVDLFSIKHKKLFGYNNEWAENLDPKGSQSKEVFGKNIGNNLPVSTTVLSSIDGYIVGYEKYANKYSLLPTNILSSSNITYRDSSAGTYELSAYNSYFGWPLLLPDNVNGTDIEKYYEFYEHIPTPEGTQLEGIINFRDLKTTLTHTNSSYNQWIIEDGIMENIITQTLKEIF